MHQHFLLMAIAVGHHCIHDPETIADVGLLETAYEAVTIVPHHDLFDEAMGNPGHDDHDFRTIPAA
ncbi:hypothetical protein D3C87_2032410 [compost metagenome]